MSNMLIDDRPIIFLPMLAKALGSCERAIVLQQIHWLLRQPNSGIWEDDLHWVWGTYEDWCNDYFPMWSPHTLRKHIQKLEQDGVLVSAQLRAKAHDRTKFYRIKYDHPLLSVASNRPDTVASDEHNAVASNRPDTAVSIYRTETSAKTSQKGKDRPPSGRKSYQPNDHDLYHDS